MRRALLLALLCVAGGCDSIFGFHTPELLTADGGPDAAPTVLTVTKAAGETGDGEIKSDVGSIDCAAGCEMATASLEEGTNVDLTATAAAGSLFTGWSGACTGLDHLCSVDVDGAVTVTAHFDQLTANVIFASSTKVEGNFGGTVGGDAVCASAAMNAGLSGNFISLLASNTQSLAGRLLVHGMTIQARGFVRMDGLPVADTVADLTANQQIWYPIKYDEKGADETISQVFAFTGANADGSMSVADCENWTTDVGSTTSPQGVWGDIGGGPELIDDFQWMCNAKNSLYCVEVDRSTPLSAPPPATGKLIWLSTMNFMPQAGGLLAADSLCQGEAPAGVTAVALLSSTTVAASSRLVAGDTYVRSDGIPVGTGAAIVAGKLQTGIWVHADGTYTNTSFNVWNGSKTIDAKATDAADDCDDWTDNSSTGTGQSGNPTTSTPWWASQNPPLFNCTTQLQIYCVEQ